jgi:hypothetical protein
MTTSFSRAFAAPVALTSGNPSSSSTSVIHLIISSPGTLCTKLASSSARLGITLRGPSLPAERIVARRSCFPKCFRRVSKRGSRGDGKRVPARRATWSQFFAHLSLVPWCDAIVGEGKTHEKVACRFQGESFVCCQAHKA